MNYTNKFYDYDDSDDFASNDYIIALQLQMQIDNTELEEEKEAKMQANSKAIDLRSENLLNDPQWEMIDPCPDIRALFQEFDKKYFWNRLGSCIVEWSKRMTICAGIFYLREGGIIRLSEPLLKYRPRKDLIETLLHEMIHAYLYLTRNFKDRGEHGDEFKSHMNRINRLAGTSITVYHSFHDEVNYHRQHVWRCDGVCRKMPPFYGYVRRAMNRAPGKSDIWWAEHQRKCNGTFEKLAEPEGYKSKNESKLNKTSSSEMSILNNSSASTSIHNSKKIDAYFKKPNLNLSSSEKAINSENRLLVSKSIQSKFANEKELVESKKSIPDLIVLEDDQEEGERPVKKLKNTTNFFSNLVECPICSVKIHEDLINSHANSHF
jgi:SprT-like domain-contaning protein Spartan